MSPKNWRKCLRNQFFCPNCLQLVSTPQQLRTYLSFTAEGRRSSTRVDFFDWYKIYSNNSIDDWIYLVSIINDVIIFNGCTFLHYAIKIHNIDMMHWIIIRGGGATFYFELIEKHGFLKTAESFNQRFSITHTWALIHNFAATWRFSARWRRDILQPSLISASSRRNANGAAYGL